MVIRIFHPWIASITHKQRSETRIAIDKKGASTSTDQVQLNNSLFTEKYSRRFEILMEPNKLTRFSHLQLCCASKMVNRIFDAQLLVFTATLLVYITVILYFVYMIYQRYFHLRSNLKIVGAYVLDVVSNCLKVALVSYGCEYTTNQVKELFYFTCREGV